MEVPDLPTVDDSLEDEAVGGEEFDEEVVDVEENKKRFRDACEDYLKFDFPQDEIDQLVHRRIRQRLADARAEYNNSKVQADIRSFFQ